MVGRAHLEPLLDSVFSIDRRRQSGIAVTVALDNTVVIEIGQREIVVAVSVSALECQIVLHHLAVLKSCLGPVRVGHAVPVLEHVVFGEGTGLTHIVDIFLSIEHLWHMFDRLRCVLKVVGDLTVARSTFLRCDQHDTISSLSTVDSCRGGIFEDLHGGNVVRINTTDIGRAHTINDVERT